MANTWPSNFLGGWLIPASEVAKNQHILYLWVVYGIDRVAKVTFKEAWIASEFQVSRLRAELQIAQEKERNMNETKYVIYGKCIGYQTLTIWEAYPSSHDITENGHVENR